MHEHKLKYLNSVMMLYFNIFREKHKILTQNTQVFPLFFLRVLLWSAGFLNFSIFISIT